MEKYLKMKKKGKIEKRKSIFSLLVFEQRLLINYKKYHHEMLDTYSNHSNGGKCVSEF